MEITDKDYKNWLDLRNEIANENDGEGLCYCGHTFTCDCSDPTFQLFKESVERGAIIINDRQNGWRTVDNSPEQHGVGE